MKKKAPAVKEDSALSPTERFVIGYKKYSNYYVLLLTIVAVSVAVAIGIALFENVLVGMTLCLIACGVYAFCSADEAKKQLGIKASHEGGRVIIKNAVACYGEEFIVPSRFEFARVTGIGDKAFDSEKNDDLRVIYLPAGITYIGESIFGERSLLPNIHFEGTEEQWKSVEIHTDLSDAVIFFDVPFPTACSKKAEK